MQELEGLKFVFAKNVSYYLDGKSIDYHDGPRGGFSITDLGADNCCGDCSC